MVLKEHGAFITDSIQTHSTLQCCHCSRHFIYLAGPGVENPPRCLKCDHVTCGRWECHECIPHEAQLEFKEGKRNKYEEVINDLVRERGGVIL